MNVIYYYMFLSTVSTTMTPPPLHPVQSFSVRGIAFPFAGVGGGGRGELFDILVH